MTVERALNILELQLAATFVDGKRESSSKRNYINALEIAIKELRKIVVHKGDA